MILGLLMIAASGYAQTTAIWRTELYSAMHEDHNEYAANNRFVYAFSPARNLELGFDADLTWADTYGDNRKHKLYNSLQGSLDYRKDRYAAGVSYRNTLFGSQKEKLGLYPSFAPLRVYEKSVQHHSTLHSSIDADPLRVDVFAMHKHLSATPWDLDLNTFELVQKDREGLDNVYLGLSTSVKLSETLSLHAGGDYKDAIFAEEGQYELTSLGGGVNFEYRINPMTGTGASFTWKHRSGDAIDAQRRNHLQSILRYRQRFGNLIFGYLMFINNSVVNQDLDELYLVSNYLRGHLIYTLPYDDSNDSYVLLGGKYSPENDADAYFVETRGKIWHSVYAGGSINIQSQNLSVYQAKLGYKLSPFAEIDLYYAYRDLENAGLSASRIGIDTSLYW